MRERNAETAAVTSEPRTRDRKIQRSWAAATAYLQRTERERGEGASGLSFHLSSLSCTHMKENREKRRLSVTHTAAAASRRSGRPG